MKVTPGGGWQDIPYNHPEKGRNSLLAYYFTKNVLRKKYEQMPIAGFHNLVLSCFNLTIFFHLRYQFFVNLFSGEWSKTSTMEITEVVKYLKYLEAVDLCTMSHDAHRFYEKNIQGIPIDPLQPNLKDKTLGNNFVLQIDLLWCHVKGSILFLQV